MIELKDVNVSFGDHKVLSSLSLTIPLEGTTVIYGPSGSGKTTLLRIIMGLQKPTSGKISGLEGKQLSVVFQEDRLLPWQTAKENVAQVSDDETAQKWLNLLGLAEAMNQKPKELSGGMNRRVAIARALAYGGDMLVLDEPFAGLDDAAKAVSAKAILSAGMPILLVTHSREEAALLAAARSIELTGTGQLPR